MASARARHTSLSLPTREWTCCARLGADRIHVSHMQSSVDINERQDNSWRRIIEDCAHECELQTTSPGARILARKLEFGRWPPRPLRARRAVAVRGAAHSSTAVPEAP